MKVRQEQRPCANPEEPQVVGCRDLSTKREHHLNISGECWTLGQLYRSKRIVHVLSDIGDARAKVEAPILTSDPASGLLLTATVQCGLDFRWGNRELFLLC